MRDNLARLNAEGRATIIRALTNFSLSYSGPLVP